MIHIQLNFCIILGVVQVFQSQHKTTNKQITEKGGHYYKTITILIHKVKGINSKNKYEVGDEAAEYEKKWISIQPEQIHFL